MTRFLLPMACRIDSTDRQESSNPYKLIISLFEVQSCFTDNRYLIKQLKVTTNHNKIVFYYQLNRIIYFTTNKKSLQIMQLYYNIVI